MELITENPIPTVELLSQAHHRKAGAVVLFSGEVRNHHEGQDVGYLEYECHKPMAEKMIRGIVDKAQERWDLHHAVCVHRVGRLEIGESAIVVITSSAHREEAYSANRYIVDQVKKEVPIWKKEYFADGKEIWR